MPKADQSTQTDEIVDDDFEVKGPVAKTLKTWRQDNVDRQPEQRPIKTEPAANSPSTQPLESQPNYTEITHTLAGICTFLDWSCVFYRSQNFEDLVAGIKTQNMCNIDSDINVAQITEQVKKYVEFLRQPDDETRAILEFLKAVGLVVQKFLGVRPVEEERRTEDTKPQINEVLSIPEPIPEPIIPEPILIEIQEEVSQIVEDLIQAVVQADFVEPPRKRGRKKQSLEVAPRRSGRKHQSPDRFEQTDVARPKKTGTGKVSTKETEETGPKSKPKKRKTDSDDKTPKRKYTRRNAPILNPDAEPQHAEPSISESETERNSAPLPALLTPLPSIETFRRLPVPVTPAPPPMHYQHTTYNASWPMMPPGNLQNPFESAPNPWQYSSAAQQNPIPDNQWSYHPTWMMQPDLNYHQL